MIYAQQAELVNGEYRILTGGNTKYPVFKAKLGTDVTLVGFDMTEQQAVGNGTSDAGYFFALQERPGQMRFGLDQDTLPEIDLEAVNSWDDLAWSLLTESQILKTELTFVTELENFAPVDGEWGNSSSDMAIILTQKPTLFLAHASAMMVPL